MKQHKHASARDIALIRSGGDAPPVPVEWSNVKAGMRVATTPSGTPYRVESVWDTDTMIRRHARRAPS